MTDPQDETTPAANHELLVTRTKTLESAGWGLFLLWLGIILLFSLGWPLFLIGSGIIALVIQYLRRSWKMKLEPFWLILGVVFVVAGLWESSGSRFPIVPIALILFGIGALFGVYRNFRNGSG